MPDPSETVFATIRELLERRNAGELDVTTDSLLDDDLSLDSMEIAELSAVLEDTFGTDPYSAGLLPKTVGEVTGFYAAG